jgi:hypothetical protein
VSAAVGTALRHLQHQPNRANRRQEWLLMGRHADLKVLMGWSCIISTSTAFLLTATVHREGVATLGTTGYRVPPSPGVPKERSLCLLALKPALLPSNANPRPMTDSEDVTILLEVRHVYLKSCLAYPSGSSRDTHRDWPATTHAVLEPCIRFLR